MTTQESRKYHDTICDATLDTKTSTNALFEEFWSDRLQLLLHKSTGLNPGDCSKTGGTPLALDTGARTEGTRLDLDEGEVFASVFAKDEDKNVLEPLKERLLDAVDDDQKRALETAINSFLTMRTSELGTKECSRFFHCLEHMLNPPMKEADARVSRDDRRLLTMQCLKLATTPKLVDQSRFNTCELACIEKILWQREPSSVAAVIARAATNGTIKNYNGRDLTISEEAFRKDLESPTSQPKPGHRLFSSQIFQTSLVEQNGPTAISDSVPASFDTNCKNQPATMTAERDSSIRLVEFCMTKRQISL